MSLNSSNRSRHRRTRSLGAALGAPLEFLEGFPGKERLKQRGGFLGDYQGRAGASHEAAIGCSRGTAGRPGDSHRHVDFEKADSIWGTAEAVSPSRTCGALDDSRLAQQPEKLGQGSLGEPVPKSQNPALKVGSPGLKACQGANGVVKARREWIRHGWLVHRPSWAWKRRVRLSGPEAPRVSPAVMREVYFPLAISSAAAEEISFAAFLNSLIP